MLRMFACIHTGYHAGYATFYGLSCYRKWELTLLRNYHYILTSRLPHAWPISTLMRSSCLLDSVLWDTSRIRTFGSAICKGTASSVLPCIKCVWNSAYSLLYDYPTKSMRICLTNYGTLAYSQTDSTGEQKYCPQILTQCQALHYFISPNTGKTKSPYLSTSMVILMLFFHFPPSNAPPPQIYRSLLAFHY